MLLLALSIYCLIFLSLIHYYIKVIICLTFLFQKRKQRPSNIIITNDKNDVRLIRKGVKQIAPQSYLEDKIYAYTKGGILKFYYDNASKVNDGVAKSKSEKKHNVHRFDNGQLSYYIPLATYAGKELHYDKKYIYKDGKIKTYMVDVDVIRGEDKPRKRYDF